MYYDIPLSCEFGGCKLFDFCKEEYKLQGREKSYMSPPLDKNYKQPCEKAQECFTYMDKYNNDQYHWAEVTCNGG